jgi:error-prone DNA polymerase
VRCAGVVLVRQRPGSAKGVVFMTLEDETGIANIVVWPKIMERFRKEVMGARLLMVEGRIQSSPDKVVHLVAEKLFDRTLDLKRLSQGVVPRKSVLPPKTAAFEPLDEAYHSHAGPRTRHPRHVRILPRSRDFH